MTQEDAVRKALACLRLSKSNNAAEAALAAAKAQEIITRFNLSISDADFDDREKVKDDEPIQYFDNDPIDDVDRANRGWALRLCVALADINGCKLVQCPNSDGHGGKRLLVVGRPSDVQTVRYLYGYFKRQTIELCDANAKGNSGTYKNHYKIGVTDTLNKRFWEQKRKTEAEVRGENVGNPLTLIKVNNALARQEQRNQAVDLFMKTNLKLGKGHASGWARSDDGGRSHGQRDGQSIRLTSAKAGIGRGVAGALA